MTTEERPQSNHTQTYTQTDAARLCGITQRALVARDGRTGYLTKLHQCYPGRYYSLVCVGSFSRQSEIRFTVKGVEELRDLIQALSPEPPLLDDDKKPTYDPTGKVLKAKKSPAYTLNQYAEFVWFREGIDGAEEVQKLERDRVAPTAQTIQAAAVQEEAGALTIHSTSEPAEVIFDRLEQMDSSFWEEVKRRAEEGYQQGRFLKTIEVEARTKGEFDVENDYYGRSKNVASRKPNT
jgi:hypothetical protein